MHYCCSNCCILVSEYEFVSPMYDNDNIKCVKVIIFVTQFIKIMMATNKKVLLTSVSQASILCDLCFFKFLYKNCSTCNDKNDLIKESVNARNNLIFFDLFERQLIALHFSRDVDYKKGVKNRPRSLETNCTYASIPLT